MSRLATAMLGYGIILGEELPKRLNPNGDYFDLSDFLIQEEGLAKPARSNKEAYKEYNKKKLELEKDCPVEICNVADCNSSMYVIVVKGSMFTANEMKAITISSVQLQLEQTKIDSFTEFCKKYGIKGNHKWILMSKYD